MPSPEERRFRVLCRTCPTSSSGRIRWDTISKSQTRGANWLLSLSSWKGRHAVGITRTISETDRHIYIYVCMYACACVCAFYCFQDKRQSLYLAELEPCCHLLGHLLSYFTRSSHRCSCCVLSAPLAHWCIVDRVHFQTLVRRRRRRHAASLQVRIEIVMG